MEAEASTSDGLRSALAAGTLSPREDRLSIDHRLTHKKNESVSRMMV